MWVRYEHEFFSPSLSVPLPFRRPAPPRPWLEQLDRASERAPRLPPQATMTNPQKTTTAERAVWLRLPRTCHGNIRNEQTNQQCNSTDVEQTKRTTDTRVVFAKNRAGWRNKHHQQYPHRLLLLLLPLLLLTVLFSTFFRTIFVFGRLCLYYSSGVQMKIANNETRVSFVYTCKVMRGKPRDVWRMTHD